jgi:hypothetical protein
MTSAIVAVFLFFNMTMHTRCRRRLESADPAASARIEFITLKEDCEIKKKKKA